MKKSDKNVVNLFEQSNQGVQKIVLIDSMKMKREAIKPGISLRDLGKNE